MAMFYVFFALCLVNSALADGNDETLRCMKDIKYLTGPESYWDNGIWHKQAALAPDEFGPSFEKCGIWMILPYDETDSEYKRYDIPRDDEPVTEAPAKTLVPSSNEPSKRVRDYDNLIDGPKGNFPLDTLGTDHHNYFVLYSCNDKGGRAGNIFTKALDPSKEVMDKAIAAFTNNKLNVTIFDRSDVHQCAEKLRSDLFQEKRKNLKEEMMNKIIAFSSGISKILKCGFIWC